MLDFIRQSASSWFVKVIFGIIILVFVFWGVGSFTGGGQTQVVATVNEEPILQQDFLLEQQRYMESIRRQRPQISEAELQAMNIPRQVLEKLVADKLLLQEAEALGIAVTDEELRQVIASVPAFQDENGQFDPDLYRLALAQERYTLGQFERDTRHALRIQRLQGYVSLPAEATEAMAREIFEFAQERRALQYLLVPTESFVDQVTVTQEEIEAFYAEHKEDYAVPARLEFDYLPFTATALADKVNVPAEEVRAAYERRLEDFSTPERVQASHILIRVEENAPEADVEAARASAEAARQRVTGPDAEDFAEVAREVSEGPTAPNGGDLGLFGRGQMVEPFEEAAFALQPGEVSEVVRTPFGFHVIKVVEREDAAVTPFEEVRDELRRTLAEDRAVDLVSSLLDVALEQIYAGRTLEETAAEMNLPLQTTDEPLTRRAAQNALRLTPEAAARLFEQPEGVVTDTPLEAEDGFILAVPQTKLPSDYKPLDEIRETVRERLLQQKADALAKEQAEALARSIREEGPTETQTAQLTLTTPFDRQGFIPELGVNPELTAAAFAAVPGEWLPDAYFVNEGYVAAKLVEVIPPPAEQWAAARERWMADLANSMRQELFQAYLETAQAQAEIPIFQPGLVE